MAYSAYSGDKLYIATGATANSAPANAAAYAALTWLEVKGVMQLGEYGDSAQIIPFKTLGNPRVNKLIGTRDAGNKTVSLATDPLDAGQLALEAASKTNFTYNFKREFLDAADANDTNGVSYFGAKVAGGKYSATSEGGDAVRSREFTLAITTALTDIASVAVA
jgi:hypothetical protein